jgi:hypothetical protein
MVAKKEKWRQHNVWALVRQFSEATGLIFTSPIAPILFGDADAALEASRYNIAFVLWNMLGLSCNLQDFQFMKVFANCCSSTARDFPDLAQNFTCYSPPILENFGSHH